MTRRATDCRSLRGKAWVRLEGERNALVEAHVLGDHQGVQAIRLRQVAERLLECLDPAGVDQRHLEIEALELRRCVEMVEEMPPVEVRRLHADANLSAVAILGDIDQPLDQGLATLRCIADAHARETSAIDAEELDGMIVTADVHTDEHAPGHLITSLPPGGGLLPGDAPETRVDVLVHQNSPTAASAPPVCSDRDRRRGHNLRSVVSSHVPRRQSNQALSDFVGTRAMSVSPQAFTRDRV